MIRTADMISKIFPDDPLLSEILYALIASSHKIFTHVKNDDGMTSMNVSNSSGDTQIKLDIIADKIFRSHLKEVKNVKYIVSEEQADLIDLGGDLYSIVLDPLDGSKSAKVGIPCGSIFGVFKNISRNSDFCGKNIIASGFFVYGARHELFIAAAGKVSRYREQDEPNIWTEGTIGSRILDTRMLSINAANYEYWPPWMQRFYLEQFSTANSNKKPFNMRWYASLVSDVKRLLLEGGLFAYPGDIRAGYEHGQLRLVYEAIPMAFLVSTFGGSASSGETDILTANVTDIHQKTPLFLGSQDHVESVKQFSSSMKP